MKASLIAAATASLVALCGLSACGSAPVTSYYTLMAPSSPSVPASAPSSPFVIEVLPVGVPEALDQAQLVVRKSDSGVAVLENERWTAPLGQEMRAALSDQLTRQLGTQDVGGLSVPAGKPVLRIQVQVRRLDAWPGDRVNLEADWSIAQANDAKARLSCRSVLTERATGAYPELVQAQQRALTQLSRAIASTAAQWPRGACAG